MVPGQSAILRGYYDNRFRGTAYYAGQAELRLPLKGHFGSVLFIDSGDVADADHAFGGLRTSYGAGVRLALKAGVNLRLDYEIGHDQHGLFFTFGEAF